MGCSLDNPLVGSRWESINITLYTMQKNSVGINSALTPKVSFDSHLSSHPENKLRGGKRKITFLQWFTWGKHILYLILAKLCSLPCHFFFFFFELKSIFCFSYFLRGRQLCTYLSYSYKSTPGTHKWLTLPEPETVAPCPWPCSESLALLGLKVMASQSSSLTVTSQFPRLRHGSIFHIFSLCQW